MTHEIKPAVMHHVLGHVEPDDGSYVRTALHVDFDGHGPLSDRMRLAHNTRDRQEFNAVGSRVARSKSGANIHLPVLEVAAAYTQAIRLGSKAVIHAIYTEQPLRNAYKPESRLRDVLGDNGIDLEIFEDPMITTNLFNGVVFAGKRLAQIALRSRESDVFEIFAPHHEADRHHVYIQKAFSKADNDTLLTELANIGFVEQEWLASAQQAEMGVIPTPWPTE